MVERKRPTIHLKNFSVLFIMKTYLNFRTTTGRNLPFQFFIEKIDEKNIITNKLQTDELCKNCKMYASRGSCPPFAVNYEKVFRGKFKHYYLLICKIAYLDWMGPKVRVETNRNRKYLLASSFVEIVIKSFEKI